jgi:hypothetical protein
MTRHQLDQLRLYKGWCAFCHNEYTKNLLCVLEELSRQLYGVNATISNQFFGLFALDHKEIKLLIAHRAKHKSTHLLNDVDGIIIGGGVVVRPLQFPLG